MQLSLDQLNKFASDVQSHGKRTVDRYFKLLRNTSNFDQVLNEIEQADALIAIRDVDDNLRNFSTGQRERVNKRIQFLVS